jgi:hypothetical protein
MASSVIRRNVSIVEDASSSSRTDMEAWLRDIQTYADADSDSYDEANQDDEPPPPADNWLADFQQRAPAVQALPSRALFLEDSDIPAGSVRVPVRRRVQRAARRSAPYTLAE